jgi:hypothetical protein
MVAAVDFVSSLSFAGPKVGYLAVCASAQYALRAAAGSARLASLVTVAGWFHDATSVAPFFGGEAGVSRRLERASDALDEYRRSGKLRTVPAYAPGDERAGMSFDLDYYGNPSRGAVKEWSNQMTETSWLSWLTFDGLAAAASVSTPTQSIHNAGGRSTGFEVGPASSPTITVPHGVQRTGSHDVIPVRIVSTTPSERRTRCTPGSVVPCSLHTMRCVGCRSSGHSAIMSMLGPAFGAAVTTRTRRPLATVMRDVGSCSAVLALTLAVEDAASGSTIPNSWTE